MQLLLWFAILCPFGIFAVDQSKFRKCEQTGFCRKYRKPFTDNFSPDAAFAMITNTLKLNKNKVEFKVKKMNSKEDTVLISSIEGLSNGAIRLRIVENSPLHGKRWEPDDILNELHFCDFKVVENEVLKKYIPGNEELYQQILNTKVYTHDCGKMRCEKEGTCTAEGEVSDYLILLTAAPFSIKVIVDGMVVVGINSRNFMHFEHHRVKGMVEKKTTVEVEDVHQGKKIVDYGEDGLAIYEDGSVQKKLATSKEEGGDTEENWEESFGAFVDSKPYGPASVGMDFDFPNCKHVYGIPEHASDFALKTTRNNNDDGGYAEPYRLYNLDVFEYDLDVPMALYGSIPVMIAHGAAHTSGIFWNNPTETFIDIQNVENHKSTHWMSESGVIDVFIFPGMKIQSILKQYTDITGKPYLPPMFSLAYHQCRWNYKSEQDVAKVNAGFELAKIPYDVLWLDIEHTNGKRYFTWDENLFPNPIDMQKNISYYGRKMVTIVDPHMKRDDQYSVHQEASKENMYIKQKDGTSDFDGWCWPGSSSYVDFTSKDARKWWAKQFEFSSYQGSTIDLYVWNDMNEPSVFNGPEISMAKDNKNIVGIEHREWHNLYGLYMQQATMEGLVHRQQSIPSLANENTNRPFVLSRAFAAGSQRHGAIWTGDNLANWEHLNYATKMLLSMSVTSLSFVGADVGGFFGNPDKELMVRWYQAASFQPFFRGHAHHDAKRREPYLYEEPEGLFMRNAIVGRYALLPYIYTLFWEANTTGMPVMRSLWMEFPKDTLTFSIDNAFLLGNALYVFPVTAPNVVESTIYLPGPSLWYNYYNGKQYNGQSEHVVPSPLSSIPVFQRGGTVFAKKVRVRRSSALMRKDPYTLSIAVDDHSFASGKLYLDDEVTMRYDTGEINVRQLELRDNVLSNFAVEPLTISSYVPENKIERIIVYGMGKTPKNVVLQSQQLNWNTALEPAGSTISFHYDASSDTLTIRKPDVLAGLGWDIALTF